MNGAVTNGSGLVAVCLKWVDRRPDVDPLTGAVVHDARAAGTSDADDAALEWALRLGERWGRGVVAISAGPPEADAALHAALAAGAMRAIRIPCRPETPSDAVAAMIAAALPPEVDLTVCGNWSVDRGSGSVPAFLAARRDAAQALGLISLEPAPDGEHELRAVRRLDGGRRERLRVPLPAVISVEGGSSHLRRASLPALIAARRGTIEIVDAVGASRHDPHASVRRRPFRPRTRPRPAPHSTSARERILELTGALVDPTPPQRVVLSPPEAATRLVAQLRTWGYLE